MNDQLSERKSQEEIQQLLDQWIAMTQMDTIFRSKYSRNQASQLVFNHKEHADKIDKKGE